MRALTQIMLRGELPAELRPKALALALRHATEEGVGGGYVWAMGVLCATDDTPAAIAEETAIRLMQLLPQTPHPVDVIDALGHLAAGPRLPLARRIAAADLFVKLLEETEEANADVMHEVTTADGTRYEFGARAEFNVVAVPAVLEAMRRMCLSPEVAEGLRGQMAGRLVGLWQKVADWEVIGGPHSSQQLAEALGVIGCWPHTALPQKLSIARALRRHASRLSAVSARRSWRRHRTRMMNWTT